MEKLQIFQKPLKKLKFLRKFLQKFILGQENPGMFKINFWRDYQQILKKYKKIFCKNYQRNYETSVRKCWENFQTIFKKLYFWVN